MIATLQEIQKFLDGFHEKVKVFDIFFFDERPKNLQTLSDLPITRNERLEVIKTIQVTDYAEGPIRNMLNSLGDLWVFGKDVKGQEVYIKIAYGLPDKQAICISFHIAEFPIKYPYKK